MYLHRMQYNLIYIFWSHGYLLFIQKVSGSNKNPDIDGQYVRLSSLSTSDKISHADVNPYRAYYTRVQYDSRNVFGKPGDIFLNEHEKRVRMVSNVKNFKFHHRTFFSFVRSKIRIKN